MNFPLYPFEQEFDIISFSNNGNSLNVNLFQEVENYLIQEKSDKKDNNNQIRHTPFIVEKTEKEKIGKRGRKKKENNLAKIKYICGIHGNKEFDNLERKIQVDYIKFIVNFSNDAIKTENKYCRHFFKQIDTNITETINYNHSSKLRESSIGYILNQEISKKYKKYGKSENKETFKKVVSSSKWLEELFKMNYLELFKYYHNQEQKLEKVLVKNKEIILSDKTRSFYYLLEKNKDIRKNLINAANTIYFNDNSDALDRYFSTDCQS